MRVYKGFSLIELLIVVAIILIIAAIAIPNFLRARISANEASAAASLRAIAAANFTYYDTYPAVGYAPDLPSLGGPVPCTPAPATACLLDSVLSAAIPGSLGKSGYQFLLTPIAGGGINSNYVTGATPLVNGITGSSNLCSTSEQILRMQRPGGGPPATTMAGCYNYPIAP